MEINEFFIGNYRSIYRKKISFSKINVFVGANNSGKTNIVKALELLCTPNAQTSVNDLNCQKKTQTISLKASISFSDKIEKKELIKHGRFSNFIKKTL